MNRITFTTFDSELAAALRNGFLLGKEIEGLAVGELEAEFGAAETLYNFAVVAGVTAIPSGILASYVAAILREAWNSSKRSSATVLMEAGGNDNLPFELSENQMEALAVKIAIKLKQEQ